MKYHVFIAAFLASFFASVFLVLVAFIFKISLDYFLTVIGTVVTSLAFGFGTYFVVIAIEAFSQLQSVRANADKVQKISDTIGLKEGLIEKFQKDIMRARNDLIDLKQKLHHSAEKVLQLVVDYAFAMAPNNKRDEALRSRFIRDAHCIRFRFILEGDSFDDEQKRMAVLSLQQFGDREAIPLIKELIDTTENQDLRQVCNVAIKAIEQLSR